MTGISPNHGPQAGGTTVVIAGTLLTGATAVKFGTTNATSFTVESATKITATSPAGTGTVDVTVTTPAGGTSGTTNADRYTYNPPSRALTAHGVSALGGPAPFKVNGTLASFTLADQTATAGQFTASINWGDGSQPSDGTVSGSAGSFSVSGTHAYPAAGQFTITVTITDTQDASNQASATDQVDVTGIAPGVTTQTPTVGGSTGAAFSGTVDPEGLGTTAHFEYGLDPKYSGTGGTTIVYDQTTPDQSVGSDFTAHNVSATVTGLVPNALYHVRLVATNTAGTATGPDQTFTTLKDPAPPAPVMGKEANFFPVNGLVFVKFPGSHSAADQFGPNAAFTKGQGFIPLTEARQLPIGTQVDARRGTLKIATATSHQGKTQSGVFSSGLFKLTQTRRGFHKGLTTLSLLEGAFPGAPSYASCTAARHRRPHRPGQRLQPQRPALARPPRTVPHPRPLQRRHRTRHRLGHDRPMRGHPHPSAPRHRLSTRLPPPQDHPRPRRPQLPRPRLQEAPVATRRRRGSVRGSVSAGTASRWVHLPSHEGAAVNPRSGRGHVTGPMDERLQYGAKSPQVQVRVCATSLYMRRRYSSAVFVGSLRRQSADPPGGVLDVVPRPNPL